MIIATLRLSRNHPERNGTLLWERECFNPRFFHSGELLVGSHPNVVTGWENVAEKRPIPTLLDLIHFGKGHTQSTSHTLRFKAKFYSIRVVENVSRCDFKPTDRYRTSGVCDDDGGLSVEGMHLRRLFR